MSEMVGEILRLRADKSELTGENLVLRADNAELTAHVESVTALYERECADNAELKKRLEEIRENAAILQRHLCCYTTVHGDGGYCDCKFLERGENVKQGISGERSGCCEAREILRIVNALLNDTSEGGEG